MCFVVSASQFDIRLHNPAEGPFYPHVYSTSPANCMQGTDVASGGGGLRLGAAFIRVEHRARMKQLEFSQHYFLSVSTRAAD